MSKYFFVSPLFCAGLVFSFLTTYTYGKSYYVSSSGGNDANSGLSEAAPFRTVAKVNALALVPGDQVLFKCGDIWRAEQLVLSKSGTEAATITFGSYSSGSASKPILSGSRPISGWRIHAGNIYLADLSSSDFPMGLNQLFRSGVRLGIGRWPNIDDSGGYSFVDGHTSGSNQFSDTSLPSGDWSGAMVHLKNIRWSMITRQVTASSGTTLTVNQGFSCLISSWSTCTGWGYFINNHLATLDRDGEWYYDAATRKIYLYSSNGVPSDIEGSVILEQAETLRHGGLMVSDGSETAYVVVENLEICNWFNHGIGSPGGMNRDIYHHLTFRNLTIKDVDAAGVNLSSWLERPSDGRKGLRGGHHLLFYGNTIDGANHFGVSGYFAESLFEANQIQNIALIGNLNKSGMGCAITWDECTENGDGFRIRCYDVQDSGHDNTLRHNRFERIGYNGVDIFGPNNTLEQNVIMRACFSKADCGAVRTFGSDNLASTDVYNIHLIDNIIIDIPGNVDGCHASRAAFGMGLYVDNYSRDVEVRGNTIIDTSITGINFGRSSGQIENNTVYNASYGTEYSSHIGLGGDEARATITQNKLFALGSRAWTVYGRTLNNFISSDNNYIFHPFVPKHIAFGPSWTRYSFGEWKVFSGLEAHSKSNWFTQNPGDTPRSRILYNDTQSPKTFDLGGRKYLDLDQNTVLGSVTLEPFTSLILVDDGQAGLIVSAPNGGELWRRGEARVISWSAGGVGGNVRVELLKNGVLVGLIAEVPAIQGTYPWIVGQYQGGMAQTGADYKIRVRTPEGTVLSSDLD